MNYNKSIKPLYDKIAKLTFRTEHLKTQHSPDDNFEFDVTRITTCNELSLSDFSTDIENMLAAIVDGEQGMMVKIGRHYRKELLEVIISLDHLKCDFFGEGYKGLILELPEPDLAEDVFFIEGIMDFRNPTDARESKEEFYKIIADSIDTLKAHLTELLFSENEGVTLTTLKLTWKAKPAVVSYLMLQLCEAGWIDTDLLNNSLHRDDLAHVMNEVFKFSSSKSTNAKTIKNYFTPNQVNLLETSKPEIKKLQIPNATTLG